MSERTQTQRILVLGGSGFIGQHVTRALAARGHTVYATHGFQRAMPPARGVTWVPCDLGTADATSSWPSAVDTVIFLAQARDHRDFPGCSPRVFGVNVDGLHQTAQYAVRVKAARLLYASTGSVYSPAAAAACETQPVELAAARNYYVASKLAAEILLGPYRGLVTSIILRLFMPYGSGQNPDMLFPQLLEKVKSGQPIMLHGDQGLRASPVAVADVAEAFVRCLALTESVTMNLAGPEVLTLRQIGETMGRMLSREARFQVENLEPPHFVGAMGLMQQVLRWAPALTLDAGLRLWTSPARVARAG